MPDNHSKILKIAAGQLAAGAFAAPLWHRPKIKPIFIVLCSIVTVMVLLHMLYIIWNYYSSYSLQGQKKTGNYKILKLRSWDVIINSLQS